MLKGKETIRTRYGSKNLNLQYEILKGISIVAYRSSKRPLIKDLPFKKDF